MIRRLLFRRGLVLAMMLAAGAVGFFWRPRLETPIGAIGFMPATIELACWPRNLGQRGLLKVSMLEFPRSSGNAHGPRVAWLGHFDRFGPWVYTLQVPIAPFAGLFAVATAVRLITLVRRRRGGRCIRCGYDLRGIAAGTACPECGSADRRSLESVAVGARQ